jgi:RNA polymerase sigma factor (sigma-70 family)
MVFPGGPFMYLVAVGSTDSAAISYRRRQRSEAIGSAADDRVNFANVVLPHLDAAYNLAHWLTGNRTDAEDVVQEASLRAFRAIRQFGGGSARAWVLRIVRNTGRSWLRKNRPTTIVTVEHLEAVEALLVTTPGDPAIETPEATLIAEVDAKHLRAAIAALPMPFRETLLLRDVEGLSYREIAETTEVSIGTVMSRLARARQRLIGATREVLTASRSIAHTVTG